MSGLPSDEVALDFKDCLNDLQLNNRYEISNLTIIAKENIEHAQALSRTLETHIRTTAPSRKLPALYVLDSIVKNVGSPYTIYLGRNLFSIFMDAYTLVDANTRRSMESMLRTWKEPVPGSMEPTPVFPPDTTRVIENALAKARAAVMARQPPRPVSAAFRNTPTPPQQHGRFKAPGQTPQQNGYPSQQHTPRPYQAQSTPQPTSNLSQLAALLAGTQQQQPLQDDTARLNADIDNLIISAKSDFARNPYDSSIQARLKALLDLQNIMRTQVLQPPAIAAIKAQIAALSAARPPSRQAPAAPPQAWQPPASTPQPFQPPPNLAQLLQRPPSAQPAAPAGPTFQPGALEALLASTTSGQKPSTPTLRQALPQLTNLPIPPPSANGAHPAPSNQAQSLIDALRAAGLASSSNTPNPAPSLPHLPPPPPNAASLLSSLPALAHLAPPPPQPLKPRLPISQSTLKTFHPSLLTALYAAQPNQCSTCALRFPSTAPGRAAKAAHLDYHFRLNQRIADAASTHRGLHRMWFLDEREWLRLKEGDESVVVGGGAGGEEKAAVQVEKRKWVKANTGGAGGKSCPICQEAFVAEWAEEAQDWVWMDAVVRGGRVWHEGCLREVGGGGGGVEGLGGGETVLGKRKADESDPLASLKAKLRNPS